MDARLNRLARLTAVLILACSPLPGEAATTAGTDAQSPALSERASRQEHQAMASTLTSKWGIYVQRVYGVPADVWAKRMAPGLAAADRANLHNALQRDTFEGAMAELGGAGAKFSDDQAIDSLAAAGPGDMPQALGALGNDLVYTPVQPCRIIDTRGTSEGPIAANSLRSFDAMNSLSFASQGGSPTNCNVIDVSATAVALNLTAVAPAGAGYATVFPYGSSRPLASSVNYVAGAIVNNALIVKIPNPISSYDFSIYTFESSHYVADIVGYFAPPVATALQCVRGPAQTTYTTAASTVKLTAPQCPTGYTEISVNCANVSIYPIVIEAMDPSSCTVRSASATYGPAIEVSRNCCRIPGR